MVERPDDSVVPAALRRAAASGATHAGIAVLSLAVAVFLVDEAAGATAAAHYEGRALGPLRPLWIPLVYLWASVLWGLLAAWLWRTESPEASGEGWTKVKRLLWAEWAIQGLRWLAAIGLFNLGLFVSIAWTRWLGLAVGFESAVFGPDSGWVIFVPIGVGAALVAAVSVVAFRRGRVSS